MQLQKSIPSLVRRAYLVKTTVLRYAKHHRANGSCQILEPIDNPLSSSVSASLYESPDTLGLERPANAGTEGSMDARYLQEVLMGAGLRDVEDTAVAGMVNVRDVFSAGKDT